MSTGEQSRTITDKRGAGESTRKQRRAKKSKGEQRRAKRRAKEREGEQRRATKTKGE